MTLQVLIAAVGQNARALAAKMNLETAAIIINQDDYFAYEEFPVRLSAAGTTALARAQAAETAAVKAYTFAERGVGLSRNNALFRAVADIVLFSDEDIILAPGYAGTITGEFAAHPRADLILFNVAVDERRATYQNTAFKRVRWYNYGRYPAYSIAARTGRLHSANVAFSLLFGGGAKYSNGEDSLFLRDCRKKGLKIYSSPRQIGKEIYRESTWFSGYNEKFFYDRGVLYRYLYGFLAKPFALRFLLAKRGKICGAIKLRQAYRLMKSGIHAKSGDCET